MKISVVVPVYNEQENLRRLYDALCPVLDRLPHDYEIVLVDDGSTDGSYDELCGWRRPTSVSRLSAFAAISAKPPP